MMCQSGRVVAVSDHSVWVETIRASTCGSCSAQHACGHGLLNKVGRSACHHIEIPLPQHLPSDQFQVDDDVDLSIEEPVFARLALFVYLTPLLSLLTGIVVVSAFSGSEFGAMLGGVAGFVAGMLLVAGLNWRHRHDSRFQPQITAQRRGLQLLYPNTPQRQGPT